MTSPLSASALAALATPTEYDAEHDTVVFIHGYISDSRAWASIKAQWPYHHIQPVTPTLHYFGVEDWEDDGEHFGFDEHLHEVASFIEEHFTRPVHVVGWSYGASLALALATHYPQMVASLYAYEPGITSFITDQKELQSVIHDRHDMIQPVLIALKENRLEDAIRCIFDNACGSSGHFERLLENTKSIFLENARTIPLMFSEHSSNKQPTADMLQALSMPVTIAISDSARLAYSAVAHRAAAIIPRAVQQKIPKANHVTPVTDPLRFLNAIDEHFDRVSKIIN